jgi:RNA polymerase sigma-70 factor (ECF subfamily)
MLAMQLPEPAPRATAGEPRETGRRHDAALLAAVASGDDRAFAELYEAHRKRVFRLAYGILLDEAEAHEAVQEAFLRLHQAAPTWEPRAAVGTWLYRVVLNFCLGLRQRLLRFARPIFRSPGGERVPAPPSPENIAALGEAVRIIETSLAALPPKQRAAACLFLEAELAPAEIATLLDLTANAARVTVHRAMTHLRADLREAGIDALPTPDETLFDLEEL